MRTVSISDIHEQQRHHSIVVPDGDVLLVAGDLTMGGALKALDHVCTWLKHLPHKHKIVIAGNHDFCFQNHNREVAELMLREAGLIYLNDSGIEIDGVHFWGSPWQPWFHDWAFNLQRGAEIAKKWALIPDDTNVLITHGPPAGIRDQTKHGMGVGCEELLKRVNQLGKLRLHVFGHIHEGYGITAKDGTVFVNACTCTLRYAPTNAPVVVDL